MAPYYGAGRARALPACSLLSFVFLARKKQTPKSSSSQKPSKMPGSFLLPAFACFSGTPPSLWGRSGLVAVTQILPGGELGWS